MNAGNVCLKREKKNFMSGYCVIEQDLSSLVENISILHPVEREYYDTLRYEKRKKSYLLGRFAAKFAINKLINVKDLQSILISFGVFQFPVVNFIQNHNIQVSISHCDNIGIALAFPEEHPIGVDIEKIDETKVQTIKDFVSYKECKLIEQCGLSPSIGFTIIWTIKEALSKILKTGLMIDFGLLEISELEKVELGYASSFTNYTQYKAISFHVNNYIYTIVLPKHTTPDLRHLRNSLINV